MDSVGELTQRQTAVELWIMVSDGIEEDREKLEYREQGRERVGKEREK